MCGYMFFLPTCADLCRRVPTCAYVCPLLYTWGMCWFLACVRKLTPPTSPQCQASGAGPPGTADLGRDGERNLFKTFSDYLTRLGRGPGWRTWPKLRRVEAKVGRRSRRRRGWRWGIRSAIAPVCRCSAGVTDCRLLAQTQEPVMGELEPAASQYGPNTLKYWPVMSARRLRNQWETTLHSIEDHLQKMVLAKK